jgi:hypothetical protein
VVPTFVEGRYGLPSHSLALNGVSGADWVLISNSPSLDGPWVAGAITMTVWIRMHTVPASGRVAVLERGYFSDPTGISLDLLNGRPDGSVAKIDVSSPMPMQLGRWTFLGLTYDGVSLDLYVDGIQVAHQNLNVPLASGTSALDIGAEFNAPAGYATGFVDGDIYEVRLYDAALTPDQMMSLMLK